MSREFLLLLGWKLRRLREKRGLSKKELASKIGTSDVAVGQWERGEIAMNINAFRKICEYYEYPADLLLRRMDGDGEVVKKLLEE